MNQPEPPKYLLRFFKWFCKPELHSFIEGDLIEMFQERVESQGQRMADWFFIWDVLLLFRPDIIRPFKIFKIETNYMFKQNLTLSWRLIRGNKGYAFVNIAGLTMGMTVAILIGLWIWNELSFDAYFENRDKLAQVMVNQTHEGITYTASSIQVPLGNALKEGFPSDLGQMALSSFKRNFMVSNGHQKLKSSGLWVGTDFPSMFSLKLLSGSIKSLENPTSVLISESLANSLFGSQDLDHSVIRIDNRFDVELAGVYEDFPKNTSFHETKILLPWKNKENFLRNQSDWTDHCCQLFVQLDGRANIDILNEKIKNIPTAHIEQWKEEIMLHPLNKLYLFNQFENGRATGGRVDFVLLFGITGVFVLLLACINFMNLATVRSEERGKEVGIRKTLGSARIQIVFQFLSESLLYAFLSLIASIMIAWVALPFFNQLAQTDITLPTDQPVFWILSFLFALFTGLIAASYPAFYLSSFKPIKVLRNTVHAKTSSPLLRKLLVTTQFVVSITLILGTLLVFRQVQYAKNRVTGFDRDKLITVDISTPELRKNLDVIKHDLRQRGLISDMAYSSQSPSHFTNNNSLNWKGKDPNFTMFFRNVGVSPDYGETIGWDLIGGRDFRLSGDSTSMIINESTAEILGFDNPLGEIVEWRGKNFTITGIVKDMLTQSPYEPTEASFFVTDDFMTKIIIRLPSNISDHDALSAIGQVFESHDTGAPFDYQFVDQEYAKKYDYEERIGNLAAIFAFLAIFISGLGLFGLASYVAKQRNREIGIRKILGASVSNLWILLTEEFVRLVTIAAIIAVPFASLLMNDWLSQYTYRTSITWEIFAVTIVSVLFITIVIVGIQAIKVAVANPIKVIRSH